MQSDYISDFRPLRFYLKELRFLFPVGQERISSIKTKFGLMKGQIGMERNLNLSSDNLGSLNSATSYRDAGQHIEAF